MDLKSCSCMSSPLRGRRAHSDSWASVMLSEASKLETCLQHPVACLAQYIRRSSGHSSRPNILACHTACRVRSRQQQGQACELDQDIHLLVGIPAASNRRKAFKRLSGVDERNSGWHKSRKIPRYSFTDSVALDHRRPMRSYPVFRLRAGRDTKSPHRVIQDST